MRTLCTPYHEEVPTAYACVDTLSLARFFIRCGGCQEEILSSDLLLWAMQVPRLGGLETPDGLCMGVVGSCWGSGLTMAMQPLESSPAWQKARLRRRPVDSLAESLVDNLIDNLVDN